MRVASAAVAAIAGLSVAVVAKKHPPPLKEIGERAFKFGDAFKRFERQSSEGENHERQPKKISAQRDFNFGDVLGRFKRQSSEGKNHERQRKQSPRRAESPRKHQSPSRREIYRENKEPEDLQSLKGIVDERKKKLEENGGYRPPPKRNASAKTPMKVKLAFFEQMAAGSSNSPHSTQISFEDLAELLQDKNALLRSRHVSQLTKDLPKDVQSQVTSAVNFFYTELSDTCAEAFMNGDSFAGKCKQVEAVARAVLKKHIRRLQQQGGMKFVHLTGIREQPADLLEESLVELLNACGTALDALHGDISPDQIDSFKMKHTQPIRRCGDSTTQRRHDESHEEQEVSSSGKPPRRSTSGNSQGDGGSSERSDSQRSEGSSFKRSDSKRSERGSNHSDSKRSERGSSERSDSQRSEGSSSKRSDSKRSERGSNHSDSKRSERGSSNRSEHGSSNRSEGSSSKRSDSQRSERGSSERSEGSSSKRSDSQRSERGSSERSDSQRSEGSSSKRSYSQRSERGSSNRGERGSSNSSGSQCGETSWEEKRRNSPESDFRHYFNSFYVDKRYRTPVPPERMIEPIFDGSYEMYKLFFEKEINDTYGKKFFSRPPGVGLTDVIPQALKAYFLEQAKAKRNKYISAATIQSRVEHETVKHFPYGIFLNSINEVFAASSIILHREILKEFMKFHREHTKVKENPADPIVEACTEAELSEVEKHGNVGNGSGAGLSRYIFELCQKLIVDDFGRRRGVEYEPDEFEVSESAIGAMRKILDEHYVLARLHAKVDELECADSRMVTADQFYQSVMEGILERAKPEEVPIAVEQLLDVFHTEGVLVPELFIVGMEGLTCDDIEPELHKNNRAVEKMFENYAERWAGIEARRKELLEGSEGEEGKK